MMTEDIKDSLIKHLINVAFSDKMFSFHGEWTPGKTAGGCSDDPDMYAKNPQYRFSIEIGEKNSHLHLGCLK